MKMLMSATIDQDEEENKTRSSMRAQQDDCARICRSRAVPPSQPISLKNQTYGRNIFYTVVYI